MRFSLLCSGERALSFYMCVSIYIGVSLSLLIYILPMHVHGSVSMVTDMIPVSVSFDLYKNNTFSTTVYSQSQRR